MTKIGNLAPNFSLKDQPTFHPLAWTRICAEQMVSLEKNYETFEKLNTIPVGVSVDTVPSKHAWAKELKISKLRLLSDFWPHGRVAQLFGIFRDEDGFSERANIIIDEEGKIIFFKIYEIKELPDIEEIIKFLENK